MFVLTKKQKLVAQGVVVVVVAVFASFMYKKMRLASAKKEVEDLLKVGLHQIRDYQSDSYTNQDREAQALVRRADELAAMQRMQKDFGIVGFLSANKSDALAASVDAVENMEVTWVECGSTRTVPGCQSDNGGGFY